MYLLLRVVRGLKQGAPLGPLCLLGLLCGAGALIEGHHDWSGRCLKQLGLFVFFNLNNARRLRE